MQRRRCVFELRLRQLELQLKTPSLAAPGASEFGACAVDARLPSGLDWNLVAAGVGVETSRTYSLGGTRVAVDAASFGIIAARPQSEECAQERNHDYLSSKHCLPPSVHRATLQGSYHDMGSFTRACRHRLRELAGRADAGWLELYARLDFSSQVGAAQPGAR